MSSPTQKELGTIVSTPEGPSPSSVDFVVNEGVVHRGQFVEMDYSEGTLVALVNDVMKTNRYFERAESVKEFEASGKKLFDQFPTSEWEYLLARTRPLGVYSAKGLARPTFPPSPGTKVRTADRETLKKFLGFAEDGLLLGSVDFHDLKVQLPLSRLLQKHLAILAMSGAGKSYFVSVLFEELLNRTKEQGRVAVVVMDAHGEYTSFAEQAPGKEFADYSARTRLIKARDIRIGVPKLNIGLLATIIPGLSSPQKRDLDRVLNKLRRELRDGMEPFHFSTVKSEIMKDEEINDATRKVLLSWISSLEELQLFDRTDSPSLYDIVEPGVLTVIDLSDLIDLRRKQIIVSYFAQKMFFDRRMKRIPPFALVLEEAHQFIPEKVSKEGAISRSIMRTIAREGRKFGASLVLVSQRPIQLDTTTLSQCGTQVILRVTNPYDIDHIGKGAEGLDKRSLDMITSLRVGEALMIGEAVNYPVFFRVRKRLSAESRHEVSLEKAARDFEEKRGQKMDEAEEFL